MRALWITVFRLTALSLKGRLLDMNELKLIAWVMMSQNFDSSFQGVMASITYGLVTLVRHAAAGGLLAITYR